MNTVKNVEKAGRQVWLAGLGACLVGKEYAVKKLDELFEQFAKQNHSEMNGVGKKTKPKIFIHTISENLLQRYTDQPLINRYDVYQHLMDYWNETMVSFQ